MTTLFNKKILIVEDDNEMRDIITSELGPTYEIARAENGEAGLKMAEEFKPDLILLDILMPKMDGIQMLEKLRQNPDTTIARTKVIVFSNYSSGDWLLKATELKVFDYSVKSSTNVKELVKKIEAALSAPEPPRP